MARPKRKGQRSQGERFSPLTLTIHLADTPRGSFLSVDGERVAGIAAVEFTIIDDEPYGAVLTFEKNGADVRDERTTIEDAD